MLFLKLFIIILRQFLIITGVFPFFDQSKVLGWPLGLLITSYGLSFQILIFLD